MLHDIWDKYILERKHDKWEIQTSHVYPVVQHTSHWTIEHVKIVSRLYIYNYFI